MIELNENNFDEIIANSDKPVLVDFYATWCGPCKRLKPEFEKFSEKNSSVVSVLANVDNLHSRLENLNVISVPTLILFKNGKEIKRRGGFCTVEDLDIFVSND
jgi:thioredoxin 1